MGHHPTKPAEIFGHDPLARALGRMTPVTLAFSVLAGGVGYMGGLAALFGFFWAQTGRVASQTDLFNQLNFFVIFPAIAFYYLWQPPQIVRLYRTVTIFLRGSADTDADWLLAYQTLNVRSIWWLTGFGVAMLGMVAGVYDNYFKLGRWWYAANWLMVAGLQIARGVIFYMLALIIIRHLLLTVSLNRLYQQFEIPLTVIPLRQAEGLHFISRYALSFSVIAAVVSLSLGAAPMLSFDMGVDYPYQVAAYFILVPLGFFLPLWQAHVHMARKRDQVLDKLAVEFQMQHAHLLRQVTEQDEQAATSLARLQALHETYEWTKKSPTWPFDTSTIYQFSATILAPFAFTLVQIALEMLAQ